MYKHTLELKSVSKKIGDVTRVSRLSLKLSPGDIYGLVGPKGSGKTTTLKMIAGLYRPTTGSIKVLGFDIIKRPTKAKRYIGYVPDEPTFYEQLTGKEFLEFVGKLWRMKDADRDVRIAELLSVYKIKRLAEKPFNKMSRGTRQKILMCAALMHNPALIIIDDLADKLDSSSAVITKRLLREAAKEGAVILVSASTLSEARKLCNRFGVLDKGKLRDL